MGHDHSHAHQVAGNEKRLMFALGLSTVFMTVEIIGGVVTNSLALLSDAAHTSAAAASPIVRSTTSRSTDG